MKRAWPYALALAVVVTGCYLALAPLLRSLSPAPTSSAQSRLSQGSSETLTVEKTDFSPVQYKTRHGGTTTFVGVEAKKAKKAKKKTVTRVTTTVAPATAPTSTGFAGNASSSPSSSSTGSSTPPAAPRTPIAKPATKTVNQGATSVGGVAAVDQSSGNEGFAGGNSSGQSTFGQKPVAGN